MLERFLRLLLITNQTYRRYTIHTLPLFANRRFTHCHSHDRTKQTSQVVLEITILFVRPNMSILSEYANTQDMMLSLQTKIEETLNASVGVPGQKLVERVGKLVASEIRLARPALDMVLLRRYREFDNPLKLPNNYQPIRVFLQSSETLEKFLGRLEETFQEPHSGLCVGEIALVVVLLLTDNKVKQIDLSSPKSDQDSHDVFDGSDPDANTILLEAYEFLFTPSLRRNLFRKMQRAISPSPPTRGFNAEDFVGKAENLFSNYSASKMARNMIQLVANSGDPLGAIKVLRDNFSDYYKEDEHYGQSSWSLALQLLNAEDFGLNHLDRIEKEHPNSRNLPEQVVFFLVLLLGDNKCKQLDGKKEDLDLAQLKIYDALATPSKDKGLLGIMTRR